jgi:hypothetical protein
MTKGNARVTFRARKSGLRSGVLRGIGVAILANLLFLTLMLAVQPDRGVIVRRVREAFETGELGNDDFLQYITLRGWFQYNDCNVLQMLANQSDSRLQRALAPTLFWANNEGTRQCVALRRLLVDGADASEFLVARYGRYWHGYNVVAAVALHRMELKTLRRMLFSGVGMAIAVLGVAALKSRRYTRRTGLMIAATSAALWGMPYFAPGLTQGPGDALLLLGVAGIAIWRTVSSSLGTLMPYAAGFGATIVFFEMLTGQLPVAACWLAAITLSTVRDERDSDVAAPVAAVAAVIAFGAAAVATVIAKQVLAVTIVEAHAGTDVLERLGFYMRMPPPRAPQPAGLLPFVALARSARMLTYGRGIAGYALIVVMTATWLAAGVKGWRERHSDYGLDLLTLCGAALIPAIWVLVLPNHTAIHGSFMVRMLVAPISLAPLALLWPRAKPSEE